MNFFQVSERQLCDAERLQAGSGSPSGKSTCAIDRSHSFSERGAAAASTTAPAATSLTTSPASPAGKENSLRDSFRWRFKARDLNWNKNKKCLTRTKSEGLPSTAPAAPADHPTRNNAPPADQIDGLVAF